MKRNSTRLPRALMALLIITVPGMLTGSARAQSTVGTGYGMGMGMGMGYGMGMGMGTFRYAPSPTDYLNQRSSLNNGRRSGPATPGSMADNPNAYYNKVRDDGSGSSSDPQVHRSMGHRRQPSTFTADPPRRQPAVARTKTQSTPRQVPPLHEFFDGSEKIAWPAEVAGDPALKEKRKVFEQASLAVLKESRQHGAASVETVEDARQKLLDYGRPALQQVRASSTPETADTFHHFLRSLYDSLDRSAAPADVTPASTPNR